VSNLSTRPSLATVVLMAISFVIAVAGVFLLSEATLGVGALVLACLLAIYARISRAATQHAQALNPTTSTAVTSTRRSTRRSSRAITVERG
jgi:hypothetical protein